MSPDEQTERAVAAERASGWARRRHWLSALALVALGLFANRSILRQGIVGFDSYIQIVTSRVLSFSDAVANFTEPLTEGRIVASFYRPLQNFSIAFDYALWGLDPFGYQLSSWLSFGLCIAAIYWVSRRVSGTSGWLGACVATAFWGLHPVLLNVLPVPCRRSDLLVIVFLCAALAVLPATPDERGRWRGIVAALCVLLAAGAKDIGVMGLGLVFGYRFLVANETRWRTAAKDSVATLVAVLVYMLARTLVLGGLGGYVRGEGGEGSHVGRILNFGRTLLNDVVYPGEVLPAASVTWDRAQISVWLAALLFVFGVWFAFSAWCLGRDTQRRPATLILLGIAWLLPPIYTLGHLKWDAPWYAVHPLVGFALLLGGVAQCARTSWRDGKLARVESLAAGTVAALVFVLGLAFTPLWADYPEWDVATRELEETLASLDEKLTNEADDGTVHVRTTAYPELPVKQRGVSLRWVATIDRKGLKAWAQMTHPELRTRTKLHRQKLERPREAGEVIIVVRVVGVARQ